MIGDTALGRPGDLDELADRSVVFQERLDESQPRRVPKDPEEAGEGAGIDIRATRKGEPFAHAEQYNRFT